MQATKKRVISSSTSASLQRLPADVVANLCGFLTGFDAFNLSRVNSFWRNYLSDESFWCKRLRGETTTWQGEVSARQQYVQSRSMRFKALKVENMADELDAFMYLTYVPGRYQRGRQYPLLFTLTHMGAESFSFDVWFSLLPASSNEFAGGIILGLQSDTRTEGHWPHYHQQFVMVSSTGEFYCSVLSEKVVAANNLESNRWYHVALTYDHDHQHQQVFLDGLKIRSEPGSRHHEWSRLMYGQVGTGCVTSDTLNCPRPGHIGWYGFNGIIDCFRVWGGVLSQDDVVQLARGGELPAERLRASTARQTDSISSRSLQLNVRQVQCTRPAEGATLQLVNQ